MSRRPKQEKHNSFVLFLYHMSGQL